MTERYWVPASSCCRMPGGGGSTQERVTGHPRPHQAQWVVEGEMGKLRHGGGEVQLQRQLGGGVPAKGVGEGSLHEAPLTPSTKGWRCQGPVWG